MIPIQQGYPQPAPAGGFDDPTAQVGLTAVNGTATTAMRSDSAPALDQSISPTWTNSHRWSATNALAIKIGALDDPSVTSGAIEIVDSTLFGLVFESDDNTGFSITTHGAGTVPQLEFVQTSGTRASPSATTSGAVLFKIRTGGYGTSGYGVATDHAKLQAVATETWTGTAQGAKWELYTTANGATASVLTATLDSSGLTLPGAINIGSATGAATGEARASVGFAARVDGNGGGLFAGAGSNVQWFYDSTAVAWRTPNKVVTNGSIFIGDTANAFNTLGLTINQSANDNEILSLKSSDVAHGMTDITETDTYAYIHKESATAGGVRWGGVTEGAVSFYVQADYTTGDTTKLTTSVAPIMIAASKISGTNHGAMGADENIVIFRNHGTARFILDADGDSHQDVGTAWTNFDEHDDVSLLTALSMSITRSHDVRIEFAEWVEAQKPLLERLKLVTYNEDGHHFINMSKLIMLLVGSVRQLANRIESQGG